MSTCYILGRDKNFPVATEIDSANLKVGLTVFEVGRDTFSISIYFSFKIFVAIRKIGSQHHISVSFFATEILMSRPNFLINCLNQSIPCCDNPLSLLIKQCRDTDYFCCNQEFVSPNCCNLKLPSNSVNHPQLSQNFQFKHFEDISRNRKSSIQS